MMDKKATNEKRDINPENMKFEEACKKLEKAASDISDTNIPLDQAMKTYEDGIRYYNICKEILDEAKGKIERLDAGQSARNAEPQDEMPHRAEAAGRGPNRDASDQDEAFQVEIDIAPEDIPF